jgi:hypothetical protein
MCKPSLFISILFSFLLSVLSLYAEDQYGFKDIPFGASYGEVYIRMEEIQKQYDYKKYGKKADSDDLEFMKWKAENFKNRMILLGKKQDKWIRLHNDKYNLGDLKVSVNFAFDHNDRFFSFGFESERVTANYLKTKVYENVDYLTKVFKAKYGNPSECYPYPNLLNIRQGKVAPYCFWEHPKLEIFTGIIEEEMKYLAIGSVTSKSMAEQYAKHEKKKVLEGAAKGAESF